MRNTLMPKEINHKGLFMFGVLFYFIAPLVIIQSDIFDGLPGIDSWKGYALSGTNVIIYLLLVLELLVFFYLGSYLGQKYSTPKPSTKHSLGKISSKIVIGFTVVFLFLQFYNLRGSAFQGNNAVDESDSRLQGILSTSGLLVFYLHFALEQSKFSKHIFLMLFIITAIFLLGLGGRMYVIIPLVAYYMKAYNSSAKKGKALYPYLIIPVGVATLASMVGALRIGEKLDKMAYFLFAEPIFTSYSSFSFLTLNPLELAKFPTNFFVSFLNFIPSLFWPDKAEVLSKIGGLDVNIDNPLGALSVFASIYGGFGVLLGGVFIFVIGLFYGFLYKAFKTQAMNINLYYCFCAVLPFCFFRDPIGIPIKIYVSSFGLIPLIIQILRVSLKKT